MKRALLIGLALWLSGCTAMLWGDDSKAVQQAVGTDRIHAFGVANETARGHLSPGDLAMMGDQYWYVVSGTKAEDLRAVLNAGLPARFHTFDSDGKEISALRVMVRGLDDNEFSSDFCLRYPADAAAKDKLEALEFYQRKGGEYERCFVVQGYLYRSPKQVAVDYRFEEAVPVELFKLERRPRGGVARTIGKVLLTPAAVAADAVGAVTVYPAALLGIKASGGLKVIR